MTNNELMTTQDLAALAEKINSANHQANETAKKAVLFAVECGQALIAAKAQVKHGQWGQWLKGNCDIAERTAQSYMKLANDYPLLSESKAQRVADLSIREAVKELAKPKEPGAWLPSGNVFMRVDFGNGEDLYIQESEHDGFYYIAYLSPKWEFINFTVKGVRSDYVEHFILRILPGCHTINCKVRDLNWQSFKYASWVWNTFINGFLPDSHSHLRRLK